MNHAVDTLLHIREKTPKRDIAVTIGGLGWDCARKTVAPPHVDSKANQSGEQLLPTIRQPYPCRVPQAIANYVTF